MPFTLGKCEMLSQVVFYLPILYIYYLSLKSCTYLCVHVLKLNPREEPVCIFLQLCFTLFIYSFATWLLKETRGCFFFLFFYQFLFIDS